ncbi:MAG: GNAT family protein [Candidatus Paceibacterota bacterium]|jgi:RimJ/RimL family protein N-acetyltransferase
MKKINQKIVIRSPKISDVDSLLEMINSLVEERAMITIQKKITLEQERKYLKGIIKDKESIHLFLIINGEVMGNARITKHENIKSHIGEIGISLKKEGRGLGLGEKLFKRVMEIGIKKFKLKIVILYVFAKNKIALSLYKKMGFKKVGTIKGGVKHYEKYDDYVMMVKYID